MVTPLFFALSLLLVALAVYVGKFSGRLRAERTRIIAAPLGEVYRRVADFSAWPEWHPWLEHDPELSPAVTGVADRPGCRCGWNTERAGEYEVVLQALEPGKRIVQRVVSRQPFRYRARITWEFSAHGEQTVVTWRLKGRVAFALRAFASTVRGAIELDFRYALDRLARCAGEPEGEESYRLEYMGLRDVPASRQFVERWQGPISGLHEAVGEVVAQLRGRLAEAGVSPAGEPFAAFMRTNLKLGTTVCRIGIPITGEYAPLSDDVEETPAHRAWGVRLIGSRKATDIAWYEAMQRLRMDGLQPNPKIPPVERYMEPTSEGGMQVTEVMLPVREG
jgi:hypothetical protein